MSISWVLLSEQKQWIIITAWSSKKLCKTVSLFSLSRAALDIPTTLLLFNNSLCHNHLESFSCEVFIIFWLIACKTKNLRYFTSNLADFEQTDFMSLHPNALNITTQNCRKDHPKTLRVNKIQKENMDDNNVLHRLIFFTLDQYSLFPFTHQQPTD